MEAEESSQPGRPFSGEPGTPAWTKSTFPRPSPGNADLVQGTRTKSAFPRLGLGNADLVLAGALGVP